MKYFITTIFILIYSLSFARQSDSTKVEVSKDSTKILTFDKFKIDSTKNLLRLPQKPIIKRPTMPPLHISDKTKPIEFRFDLNNRFSTNPDEIHNWDALNMPTNRYDYDVKIKSIVKFGEKIKNLINGPVIEKLCKKHFNILKGEKHTFHIKLETISDTTYFLLRNIMSKD